MFRSLMAIIRELYLYITKVIFNVKTLGKIMSLYKLGDVAACRRAACVLCKVHCTQHTCNFTECFNTNITLVRYR